MDRDFTFPPRIVRSSATVDVVTFVFSMTILLGFVPVYARIGGSLIFLYVFTPIIIYSYLFIFLPLVRSRPSRDARINEIELPSRAFRVRVGKKVHSCAIDLVFVKFIILQQDDINSVYNNWKSHLHHEVAHIIYGDSVIFHFAATATLMILSLLPATMGLAMAILQEYLEGQLDPESISSHYAFLTLAIILLMLSVVLILWFQRNLQDREYNADNYAHHKLGEEYIEFLERVARRERLKRRSARFSIWHIFLEIYASITHPDIEQRISCSQSSGENQPDRSWSSGVLVSLFINCSFFSLAFLCSLALNSDFRVPVISEGPLELEVAFIVVTFLIIFFSCVCIISIFVKEISEGPRNIRRTTQFSIIFGIINTLMFLCLNQYIQSDLNFSKESDSNINGVSFSIIDIFVIFGSFIAIPLTAWLLNYTIKKTTKFDSYSYFLHSVIGTLSYAGGLIYMKFLDKFISTYIIY